MMVVLSLFDGCGMAYQALKNLGIKVDKYYASEVDKWAMQISQRNHPDIINLGSVSTVNRSCLSGVPPFLLIGGSPCQDLSVAKSGGEGLDGSRSGLFWEYVRCLLQLKPKYFLLENVASMKAVHKETISIALKVEPILINSSLLTAQNRKRLYWTNIQNITQPKEVDTILQDVLEEGVADRQKSFCLDASYYKGGNLKQYKEKSRRQLIFLGGIEGKRKKWLENGKELSRNFSQEQRVYAPQGLSSTLSANGGGLGATTGLYYTEEGVRKLTPIECERLQGLPDNYTEGVSNTQRYKMIGNGFTVPVIEHILSFMELPCLKGDKQ